ncbi:hypothetical protein GCM10010339_92230 [Streptomyces alanosinicus]|uniref:Uncharacterized protein n=1 Tax=Streptomyces alanosinicus TaxID=68171 RepID=A0A919D9L8_9ACTN|nr:hypothetical protein GCM10010339_92230 [Streptomyces alanosinicus]
MPFGAPPRVGDPHAGEEAGPRALGEVDLDLAVLAEHRGDQEVGAEHDQAVPAYLADAAGFGHEGEVRTREERRVEGFASARHELDGGM